MAIVTATAGSASSIQTLFNAAAPGDIIECPAGNYGMVTLTDKAKNTGNEFGTAMTAFFTSLHSYIDNQRASPGTNLTAPEFTPDLATIFANNVTIRAQNRATPPLWQGRAFFLDNVQGITLDGLNIIGNQVEQTVGGVQYPAGTKIISLEAGHKNTWIKNCIIRFHMDQIWQRPGSNFVMERCEMSQRGRDYLQCYCAVDNYLFRRNDVGDDRVYRPRMHDPAYHPDGIQMRNSSADGWIASKNVLFEENNFDCSSYTGKPIFINNPRCTGDKPGVYEGTPGSVDVYGYFSICHRRNYAKSGRQHCIYIQATKRALLEGNLLRSYADPEDIPGFSLWGYNVNSLIKNNVRPALGNSDDWYKAYSDGPTKLGKVLINNVVSATAEPTGWKQPTPGLVTDTATQIGVGPYTGGGVTPPAGPLQPTNATTHGKFNGYVEVLPSLTPQRWTGILEIPSTAPAFAAACIGSGVVGGTVKNVRWIGPSATTVKPFKFAVPAFNAAGAVRLEMTHGGGGNLDIFSVVENGTMAGNTWEWKEDSGSVYSGMSSFTGGFTAVPLTPTLAALTTGQWEVVSPVYAMPGMTGRFVANVRIIPGTGVPTFTGVQWTPEAGDGQWRDMQNVGTGAGGAILWQPRPLLSGGSEHTVIYEEELNLRLRYGDGTNYSPQSTTFKSFTGPVVPPQIYPVDPGERLTYVGNSLSIAGTVMTIPVDNAPGLIEAEEMQITRDGDEITVQLPADPPPGAIGQQVIYNGQVHAATDGLVTFTAVVGQTMCLARAYDSQNRVGPCLYGYIPAS